LGRTKRGKGASRRGREAAGHGLKIAGRGRENRKKGLTRKRTNIGPAGGEDDCKKFAPLSTKGGGGEKNGEKTGGEAEGEGGKEKTKGRRTLGRSSRKRPRIPWKGDSKKKKNLITKKVLQNVKGRTYQEEPGFAGNSKDRGKKYNENGPRVKGNNRRKVAWEQRNHLKQ